MRTYMYIPIPALLFRVFANIYGSPECNGDFEIKSEHGRVEKNIKVDGQNKIAVTAPR